MKTKRIFKILGLGLAIALACSLGLSALPASAGVQEWDTITTPSWEDGVIEPGSDIWDYAVGPDGETIIAVGVVNTAEVTELEPPTPPAITGISGSFYIEDGEISITRITDSTDGVAEISGTFYGDTCYLYGNFTAILSDIYADGYVDDCVAAISGEISGNREVDDLDDVMTFSGMLYGDTTGGSWSGDTVTTSFDDVWDTLCVNNGWFTDGLDSGGVTMEGISGPGADGMGIYRQPRVWKSDDGGVTWSNITADVQDADNLPGPFITFGPFGGTAIAPDDEEWAVVAGTIFHPDYINMPGAPKPFFGPFDSPGIPACVATQDGTSNFSYTGDLEDTSASTMFFRIYDVDVSIEVGDIHNIAIAGIKIDTPMTNPPAIPQRPTYQGAPWHRIPLIGSIYRLEAGTWLSASWEDTTTYDGWDDAIPCDGPCQPWAPGLPNNPNSWCDLSVAVIDCEFSPNFDMDDTIVCMTHDLCGIPYLQSGTWASSGAWNDPAGFSEAVEITADGDTLLTGAGWKAMGLALPADYDGSDPGARVLYIYVNAYNVTTELVGGFLMRVDNDSIDEPFGPSGEPLLASIDFHGDADTGKMMVGEYMGWDNDSGDPPGDPVRFDCCEGVRVWHTVELDPCCPDWELACKNPSGPYMALVTYTPDGDKAYAATNGGLDEVAPVDPPRLNKADFFGGWCDESAFSVSLDDGVSFNQIGLIDTDIDWLSDVAVCPDCSVIYLSTVNLMESFCCCESLLAQEECQKEIAQVCECDSVWRSYDNGDTWERIYHGDWLGEGNYEDCSFSNETCPEILLRLPCEDTEDCCTLYVAIMGTDELYYSRDCGQCWTQTPGTKIPIQDVAVAAENEVMVIDTDGNFSMSTQFGRRWTDEVDTEVGSGHVVASCCLDDLVVVAGAADEPVAFSEDMGETWDLTDDLPGDSDGYAHVTCDPNCPSTIYAAINLSDEDNGVYRTTIDDGEWSDLNAEHLGYTGIAVARTGGALYASYCESFSSTEEDMDSYEDCYTGPDNCTGVARNLDPCETACCGEEDWDYLEAGLGDCTECFANSPSSLKICGCLSMDTPSILWAIDWYDYYDVVEGSDGQVWSYEDCTAKRAPELVSPMCGEDIPSEPCEGCTNVDINLCWTKICDACTYDIEIATDEDFYQPVYNYYYWDGEDLDCFAPASCANPCYLIPSGALEAGTTYYWHVRVHGEETGENARSQWSETCSFNVMSGVGLDLLAPENGSMGIGIESVGFSWTAIGGATSYSFVCSENSDLSGALASEELSGTAYTYTGTLDYSTPYFWQVTAWKDGSELATSDVGAFTTMSEPPPPPAPAPAPTPSPEIVIPAAQQITPNWIIAVIAIGAALVVLVIVLIVRTRRP